MTAVARGKNAEALTAAKGNPPSVSSADRPKAPEGGAKEEAKEERIATAPKGPRNDNAPSVSSADASPEGGAKETAKETEFPRPGAGTEAPPFRQGGQERKALLEKIRKTEASILRAEASILRAEARAQKSFGSDFRSFFAFLSPRGR